LKNKEIIGLQPIFMSIGHTYKRAWNRKQKLKPARMVIVHTRI